MNRGPSIEDIKDAANQNRLRIMHALGIKEEPNKQGLLLISDPRARDVNPSFAIWCKNGTLTFKRFGTSLAGDVVDFVSYMNGWYDLPKKGRGQALRWLIDFLSLADVPAEQLKRDAARSRTRAHEEAKDAGEQLARDRKSAFDWFTGADALRGSVAERYLREARGIDLDALAKGPRGGSRIPSVLRSLPRGAHRWLERGSPRHGEVSFWPVMMAGCTDTMTTGIVAVHRTWLKPDGSDKAPVIPSRKVWPASRGLIIPLWRGESRLSVADACAEAKAHGVYETLVLTEGVEDGLTAILARPQRRTWAFISLENLAAIVLPPCIDSVIVHRQSEWQNRQAVAAFDKGLRALRAQGRPVEEVRAMSGKDLNDTLRGAA